MSVSLDTVGAPWGQVLSAGELIPLISIVLAFLLLLMLSMGGLCVAFVKVLRSGGSTRKLRLLEVQEAQAFQNLQRGFTRMEERIDSLETLFIGRSQNRSYDRERGFE